MLRSSVLVLLLGFLSVSIALAQVTDVDRIQDEFLPQFSAGDNLGRSAATIGDLDDNGVDDLIVGAPSTDTEIGERNFDGAGAVWVLLMQSDGTVKARHKIDVSESVFEGPDGSRLVDDGDFFGQTVGHLGDLDGDDDPETVTYVGVGAVLGGSDGKGVVWILGLRQDGSVKTAHALGASTVDDGSRSVEIFGGAVAGLHRDADGVADVMAVSSPNVDDDAGAVWLLSLDLSGGALEVDVLQELSINTDFLSELEGAFGDAVAAFDHDGDGVSDGLAVGASEDRDGFNRAGAVWVFSVSDALVDMSVMPRKISLVSGGFEGDVGENDRFGTALASLGPVEVGGVTRMALAVGAAQDDGEGDERTNSGAVWVLYLDMDLEAEDLVTFEQRINDGDLSLDGDDQFGRSVASGVGGGGTQVLYAGALNDDAGGNDLNNVGAVWGLMVSVESASVEIGPTQRLSVNEGNLTPTFDSDDFFGSSVANLGDLDPFDAETVTVLAVGAPGDDDGGDNAGAVWLLTLGTEKTVINDQKLSAALASLADELEAGDGFGSAVVGLDSLLLVGAPGDNGGNGSVWVFSLSPEGTASNPRRLPVNQASGRFGSALASLGGGMVAVGAPEDDEAGTNAGAVWVVDAASGSATKLSVSSVMLDSDDRFGSAVAVLDFGGVRVLAVGAPRDDDAENKSNAGAVWLLTLDANDSVTEVNKISATEGNFVGDLDRDDKFGSALVSLGDVDGDGPAVAALAVGAVGDDDSADNQGAVRILYLAADGAVIGHQRISEADGIDTEDTFRPDSRAEFGSALARLTDDSASIDDLVVGAPGENETGAIYVMLQNFNDLPVVATPSPGVSPIDQEIDVSVSVNDPDNVDNTSIFYRRAGSGTDFIEDEMNPDSLSDAWSFSLSDAFATERGVEYFFATTDSLGGTVREPASGVFAIRIMISNGLRKEEAQPAGTEATAYRLISVPLDLVDKDPGAVLIDDLGPVDDTEWRLFEPVAGPNPDPATFPEYTGSSGIVMEQGAAFWLIVSEPGNIGSGPGTTVRTDTVFTIQLETGWNVFGNPFAYEIPVDNLSLSNGEGLDLRCYDDNDPCFIAGDAAQEQVPDWHSVDDGEQIMPFEGYAINVQGAPMLLIDPNLSSTSQNTSASASKTDHADALLWSIRIRARSRLARDTHNLAAVADEAADDWDPRDRAEPPVIGDYVSVYFPHPEWKKATTRYSTDARPLPEEGAVWPIEIVTPRRAEVHLTFEGLADVPSEYAVWLVDEVLGLRQDLRQTDTYTVVGGGRRDPRPLKLVVGRSGFIDGEAGQNLPDRFELFPNFPNPFNPATTIRYGLPEASVVEVVIYDVLGRQVVVLARGQEQAAGYHAVVWDGRDDAGVQVASGVYFARMRAERFVQTRKMVLVK